MSFYDKLFTFTDKVHFIYHQVNVNCVNFPIIGHVFLFDLQITGHVCNRQLVMNVSEILNR